ncbi:MAG: PHP domain-containing protein, partial [Planctomycetes bacterium]|nr:PHP domain-containing protein [Planctomycetota bacterium]
MRIAALTCRSFYSLLRAAVAVPRWVEKAAAYGYGAVALADVNCMAGVVDLCQAAEKAGVRPIVGVEILTDRQRAILLAEDERGYRNLCRLTTARNLIPGFDLLEQLRIDSRGVVGIGTGPKPTEELREVLPCGSLFAGCRDPEDVEQAVARGLEPIVWAGANWLENEDIEIAKLLTRIRQLSVAGAGPASVREKGGIVKAGGPWRWSDAREIRHRQAPKRVPNRDESRLGAQTPLDDATQ